MGLSWQMTAGTEAMRHSAFWIFETPLGCCGIAWGEALGPNAAWAVTRFQLPEATAGRMEARLSLLTGAGKAAEPPSHICEIVQRVDKHLRGDVRDFRDVPVDLAGAGVFAQQVYEAARQIPAGKTLSYAELAAVVGQPAAARAVGRALGANPIPLIIPCHRVVGAGGKPGGFSAPGGRATKARLLVIEGAAVNLCLELGAGS